MAGMTGTTQPARAGDGWARSPRRIVLGIAIGSFAIAALMGIAALLGIGALGESEARVLLTTVVAGCSSIAVLCNLAVAESRWRPVGVVGGLATLLPVITALVMIWTDWDDVPAGLVKAFFVGLVGALLFAQASLLLDVAGERGGWVLWGTLVVAPLLALLVIGQILAAESSDELLRLSGILGILDVLGAVVTVGLATFGRRTTAASVSLPAELLSGLDARATATGRTREQLVAEAVADFLRR